AARAEREARAAVAAREAAEAALPPLREEEAIAGAVLQRLLVERETLDAEETRARRMVQELTERIEQLRNDAAREASLASDADDSIARLAAERAALNDASAGQEARQARADAAAEAARATLTGREAELATATEALAQLSAREQALAQHASDARAQQNRAAEAERRARADAAREQARMDAALDAQAKAEAALAAAQERLAQAENAANDSETALAQAQQAEATARLQRAEADSTASTLAAEARALERMLEKNPPTGSAVLGKVRVAAGLEPALGAALGDGLQAPLMDAGHAHGSGWHELTPLDPAPALPEGAEPLSQHVQAPAALSRRLSQVGVVPADQAPAMQAALLPGQRLVTRAGDLWRWDGLVRLNADHAGNAAVLRLQQANRLQAIQADLAQAQAAATQITARHEASRQALARATAADKAARDTRRQTEAALSDLRRALARGVAEAAQAATRGSAALALAERHAAETLAAAQLVAETEQALAALDDLSNARTRLQTLRAQVDAARADVLVQRSAQEELRRDSAARARRIAEIARDMEGWQGRKAQAGARVNELESRAAETEAALKNIAADPDTLTRRRQGLAAQIAQAEARRTAAIEALTAGDQALRTAQESERDTERSAGTAREVRAAAQVHADAAADTLRQASDQIAEAHDCTPAQLRQQLAITTETLPPLATLETDIARLRRARDALGAVNLRADEDARAVSTEHDTLIAERADLEAAVAKLRGGISALNREGRERLLAAFERVNENFATLFTHLFGGGEARLVLVESDDPLEAGLEIMCQPPGKKLSTLSLLSGGEQTLTALALIFGVFLANPAPICVLDEVDAPLDDANVARFCDLLDEMTRRTETRFMVITHNAITMARMDRLFGVTMAEQGVSQLVSVDLQRAEALVA
ncbi:MAG: chromosome segregation protein SMC, partial [Pararhodobacter sp.]|nr:chromosome segregation protein SMC [Pararhodobacter sp.]